MKNDAKEHEKLNELMKKADGHPLMKKILEDEAAAILAKRTEAAEKIETLRKERDEIIPELQADLAEKESKYNEAKKALDIAINEFRQAKLALSSKNFQFENSINRQSNMLIETAPEEIDEAIQFVNKKL